MTTMCGLSTLRKAVCAGPVLLRRALFREADEIIVCVEESWSNDCALGLRGWILGRTHSLADVTVCADGVCVPITSWHSRADVRAQYPQFKGTEDVGFWVQLPRTAKHRVMFKAKVQGRSVSKTVSFTGSRPLMPIEYTEGGGLYDEFIKIVNENHLRVLEIGSRVVSPRSSSKRSLFSGTASYTGFDYYPDANTDVVGDAHRLSQYFAGQRFDAIFSLSVLEHLAMPWVVATEINKLLEVGGITYHSTHQAWPLHEMPWDFWRFSDQALKVLFSPPLGFKVINTGFDSPLRMHFDTVHPGEEAFPAFPAFGGVAVLARKTAQIEPGRFNWDVSVEEILEANSQYPKT